MVVGQLSVLLGLALNKGEWSQADKRMNHFRRLAGVLAVSVGGGWLTKGLIGFNSEMENAKNQIAGMLAFATKTPLTAQLERASTLYDDLRKKAAELPGSTADYVSMLGLIAQPLAKAGASNEQMIDVTSKSFVLAKAMGRTWQEAGRDIRDFINNGNLFARDQFLRTILSPEGYDADDKSRAKLRAMSIQDRVALLQKAEANPASKGLMDAMGSSLTGRTERVVDTLKLTVAKAGEALFGSVKDSMTKLAAWLESNQGRIQAWAATVGEYINLAFLAFRDGIQWVIEHGDVLKAILITLGGAFVILAVKALIGWAAVLWPLAVGAGLVYLIVKIHDALGLLPTIMIAVGVAALGMWLGVGGPIMWAIIGFAAMAAAVYVWKDDIIAAVDWVIAKFYEFLDTLEKIPGFAQLIEGGRAIKSLANGDFGEAAKHGLKAVNPLTAVDNLVGGTATYNAANPAGWLTDPMGQSKGTVVNQGGTTVNIHTNDVEGAKKAFNNASESAAQAAMRVAMRAGAGNK